MKEDEMYEILQKKALKVEVPESLEPSENRETVPAGKSKEIS